MLQLLLFSNPVIPLTEEEVIYCCKENVASYKKLKYVFFDERLPRTPSNKVKKYVIGEQNCDI